MTQTNTDETPRQPAGGLFTGLILFTTIMVLVAVWQGAKLYELSAQAQEAVKTEVAPKPEPAAEKPKIEGNSGDHWPLFLWAALNAVIGGATIFWTRVPSAWVSTAGNPPADKIVIMTVGGLLGLSTAAFIGVMYGLHWWELMTKGREAWQDWKPWVPVLGVFGGLAVMFLSLAAGRSEEQSQPTMRWIVYGYNAFQTGLLLLAILVIVNIIAYFQATKIFDWTASHIYDLSDATTQLLKSLDRPVKVYVLMSSGDPTRDDLQTMLINCSQYSDKLQVQYLDRESIDDFDKVNMLSHKYDILEREGMLVVYEGADGKEVTQFMKKSPDIEDTKMGMGSRPGDSERVFKGEQALYSALTQLQEGKVNPVIYFTQGNDELRLDDSSREPDRGLASLRSRMEKENFTVKELSLAPDPKTGEVKIPDDAKIIVMAGPQQPISREQVDALRKYMHREPSEKEKDQRGKLVIMMDLNRDPLRKDLIPPGQESLEQFLVELGVQVGHDVVLNAHEWRSDPTVFWIAVSRQADSGIPDAFRQISFVMSRSRTVRPAAAQQGASNVAPFLEVSRQRFPAQWAEEKVEGSPKEFVKNLVEKNEDAIAAKCKAPAPIVAVTVRDKSAPSNPNDPHAFMNQSNGEPRMVVFGTSSLINNRSIDHPQLSEYNYKMFTSSLAWVRGRAAIMSVIPPKIRTDYHFNVTQAQYGTMMWIPGPLLLLAIAGCGLGVWYLRRR